ncbi:MAG: hypothetical protein ACRAS9_02190 [Mycoplasma sp.]
MKITNKILALSLALLSVLIGVMPGIVNNKKNNDEPNYKLHINAEEKKLGDKLIPFLTEKNIPKNYEAIAKKVHHLANKYESMSKLHANYENNLRIDWDKQTWNKNQKETVRENIVNQLTTYSFMFEEYALIGTALYDYLPTIAKMTDKQKLELTRLTWDVNTKIEYSFGKTIPNSQNMVVSLSTGGTSRFINDQKAEDQCLTDFMNKNWQKNKITRVAFNSSTQQDTNVQYSLLFSDKNFQNHNQLNFFYDTKKSTVGPNYGHKGQSFWFGYWIE